MTALLILQIVITVCLVAVILMQRSSADGFTGAGGMGGEGLLSSRGAANLLTRATSILAAAFIINSLILAYLGSHREREASIIDKVIEQEAAKPITDDVAPVEPEAEKEFVPSVPTTD